MELSFHIEIISLYLKLYNKGVNATDENFFNIVFWNIVFKIISLFYKFSNEPP